MTEGSDDLHEEIDTFAAEVERKIQETEEFLESLPEFEPRSDRSKKLARILGR